ncbi:hypothetical protein LNQ52_01405 [Klebsiella pneumoniae subsp. pneumoniae]|nr:hypothetical protein [Klebsiella pneumoniae subsp. pneumoniae]
MILRASYGVRGALLPGLLRGGIAAIMWVWLAMLRRIAGISDLIRQIMACVSDAWR